MSGAWTGGPILRKEAVLDCPTCGEDERVAMVATAALAINKSQTELVPVYHCDRCSHIYKGYPPKLLGLIDKMVRISGEFLEMEIEKSKDLIEDLREQVKSFRLK